MYQEQSETENAYAENEGRIDESILVAWAEEILEREEKIKQLKQQLAEQTVPLKPDEKKEEKSLVVVKKTPLQWILQKFQQIRTALQQDDFGLRDIPGLSVQEKENLRDRRIKKYKQVVDAYYAKEKKAWELTPEAEKAFLEGTNELLKKQRQNEQRRSAPGKEVGDE